MKYKRKLPDHLRPTKGKKHNSVKGGRKNKVKDIKWSDFDNADPLADLEQTVNDLVNANPLSDVAYYSTYYSAVNENE